MSAPSGNKLVTAIVRELVEHGKTRDDVRWVGTADGRRATDIDSFFDLIEETVPDSVALWPLPIDLRIVGEDWWLEMMPPPEDGHSYRLAYAEMPQLTDHPVEYDSWEVFDVEPEDVLVYLCPQCQHLTPLHKTKLQIDEQGSPDVDCNGCGERPLIRVQHPMTSSRKRLAENAMWSRRQIQARGE